jgi:release factor glutamine methyltransferase
VNAGESFAGQTIEAARRSLSARLRTHGNDFAELDARVLIGAVLGLDLTGLIAGADRVLTADEAARIEACARRRIAGEPIARITGVKEFWGLPLQLSAATLVPRPDTETVVELALQILRAKSKQHLALRIADLGTGSGAILIALLSELPDAFGIGTDISFSALATAGANTQQLDLAQRVAFVACDYAAALSGYFDLIVSNPPYIRSAQLAGLATEVRDHDPHRALDGGADGLDAYRRLVPEAAHLLAPDGVLVLEVGQGQSGDVAALLAAAGLTRHERKTDLSGIERAVAGRRSPR